ncbi:hypothetical protein RF11_13698 [Thelohanellus kitauei]|uniref:Uncharacterized protein n=1 Tax=Thelohanellus kitauei TaxID=669202 RepID=A0A0C2MPH6_THEKT|nr:hypothetical protein RF11_13698 [Thelohanellus kitauei]
MERQELRSKMLELKNEMEDLQDDVSNLEFETSVLMAFLGLFIFSLVGFSVLIAWSRRRRHCTQQGEMVKLISNIAPDSSSPYKKKSSDQNVKNTPWEIRKEGEGRMVSLNYHYEQGDSNILN